MYRLNITLALTVVVVSQLATAQQPAPSSQRPTIDDLVSASTWPRIGAPPGDGASSDRAAWLRERKSFDNAFLAIKTSWRGESSPSPAVLRMEFERYERLVSKATAAGGYGNLALAWCARTLSNMLLAQHLMKYPSDFAITRELLAEPRDLLLGSSATTSMIEEELHLKAPSGGWRLSEDRPQLLGVIQNAEERRGQSQIETLFPPNVPSLMSHRNISGLLTNLMECETLGRVSLPGLAEYLGRGGKLTDFPIADAVQFDAFMGDSISKYRYPPMGIKYLGAEYLNVFVQWGKAHADVKIDFAEIIPE